MTRQALQPGALVVYRERPACVQAVEDRIILHLPDGQKVKVRPKDVVVLHPGPVDLNRLAQVAPADVRPAWEILQEEGETVSLETLVELLLGRFTPEGAWAVWQGIRTSDWFTGPPEALRPRPWDEVQRLQERRIAQARREAAWHAFLQRAREGQIHPEDDQAFLQDVIALALQRSEGSRVLQALGHKQTPEQAHRLLLQWGVWNARYNPYPRRFQIPLSEPDVHLPNLPDEPRLDLTHLPAYAIDDEGSQDPDDALSWDGEWLWIHVADVAALVPPDSPADLEARRRGASVYLPEGVVPMLPDEARRRLALGLQPVSPALSIGVRLDHAGRPEAVRVHPTWVRVTRMSYEDAETRWEHDTLLQSLGRVLEPFAERRRRDGAVDIRLPEVKVIVEEDGTIRLKPLVWNRARRLVQEAMLLAGEAVARFAQEHGIPLPYTVQAPPRPVEDPLPDGLAGMYALRRILSPSEYKAHPEPHHGLGLPVYVQVTSPLRRYLDLVVHQQLRAFLRSQPLIPEQDLLEHRVGPAEAARHTVRLVERLSREHWVLVYLLEQAPDWQGEGVVVDTRGNRAVVLVPSLGIEAEVSLPVPQPYNTTVMLALQGVDLPLRKAFFRVL